MTGDWIECFGSGWVVWARFRELEWDLVIHALLRVTTVALLIGMGIWHCPSSGIEYPGSSSAGGMYRSQHASAFPLEVIAKTNRAEQEQKIQSNALVPALSNPKRTALPLQPSFPIHLEDETSPLRYAIPPRHLPHPNHPSSSASSRAHAAACIQQPAKHKCASETCAPEHSANPLQKTPAPLCVAHVVFENSPTP